MNDITNKEDIKVFVDIFYNEVQKDQLIGPVFAAVIPNGNWTPHLERMYSFWNTVLFGAREYRGNPFSKHSSLPIEKRHFDRWLKLLNNTLDERFSGPKTEEVKERAEKMGLLFQSKLAHIRNNNQFRNII